MCRPSDFYIMDITLVCDESCRDTQNRSEIAFAVPNIIVTRISIETHMQYVTSYTLVRGGTQVPPNPALRCSRHERSTPRQLARPSDDMLAHSGQCGNVTQRVLGAVLRCCDISMLTRQRVENLLV
ncbi:hypothetical protein HBH64_044640 [Parastagonospora nodorum]|nr:hypothetical protein HBI09_095530 [Parastagonospora nodorum]KAH4172420.1 hypothetical protein HBH43_089800 [Parastagonospora nodorum]KAH4211761.1 hypothetical protein HBI95_044840 [Parastagonospora nodorum]KAH4222264.1 hypothetical protein HBI06_146900 [Parastagonospora nodorum]KAH4232354.1 hypothetical protein HBI05_177470 [Parastagonospora nodorum]